MEGEKLGLVSRVVPGSRNQVIEEALKVARLIAANSPIAIVGTKRVLLHSRDSTVDENLEYVATWNASMLQTVVSQLHACFPSHIVHTLLTFVTSTRTSRLL